MSVEKSHEFDPRERWIELSISEKGNGSKRIPYTAEITASHLFVNPKIKEISVFGTRSMVLVEVDGDREWASYDVLTTKQRRERSILKYSVAAADTPHESWILDSVGHIKF